MCFSVSGGYLATGSRVCHQNVLESLDLPTRNKKRTLCVCVCASLAQSYLTLCNAMDCNPLGSSVCGISQARILE